MYDATAAETLAIGASAREKKKDLRTAHTEGATEKRNSSFAVVASRTKTCLAPLYPLFSFFLLMLAIEVEDEILKYDKFNSTFFPLLLLCCCFMDYVSTCCK